MSPDPVLPELVKTRVAGDSQLSETTEDPLQDEFPENHTKADWQNTWLDGSNALTEGSHIFVRPNLNLLVGRRQTDVDALASGETSIGGPEQ